MKRNLDLKSRSRNLTSLLIVILFSILLFSRCKKENLEVTQQSELSPLGAMPKDFKLAAISATGIIATSYYLENALPAGYVRDGSKDYTSYIQSAITKNSNIVFPGFPLLVNDSGLSVGSNKVITFLPGSEIRLKASDKEKYTIMEISGATNVILYNPVIIGDRDSHIGITGEHGLGIGIRGSTNVTVYSPKVSNCWGDGIYIGQSRLNPVSKNIVIKDAHLVKNRRDGISIISVDGLVLDNLYAAYSDGTIPMCGINFEPNDTTCEIRNVNINNPRTEYNGSNGIQIGTRNMLGNTDKITDITVVNHVDIGSPRYAFKMMCNRLLGTTGNMYGLVKIINPTWNKTETNRPLYLSSNQPLGVAVSSPEIMNFEGAILSYSAAYYVLMREARSGSITVVEELESPAPEPVVNPLVFAVNSGGTAFTASNGIVYSEDKNFTGGTIFTTTNAIDNTADDMLYRSERFGDFGYSIPVSNGTYEITFKFAEIYHKSIAKRQFDILAENTAIVSDLDLFSSAGMNTAYDVVKTVAVTDGTLNIAFRTDIDNAKVSAFHVIKK
ncbi:MAG: hypothetical protein H7Y07_04550 [Pyrinomonadaceae bacterium]|nr:hypothetical protein [Sphingobacteriaceae bacterium]